MSGFHSCLSSNPAFGPASIWVDFIDEKSESQNRDDSQSQLTLIFNLLTTKHQLIQWEILCFCFRSLLPVASQFAEEDDNQFIQSGQSAHNGIFNYHIVSILSWARFKKRYNQLNGSLTGQKYVIKCAIKQVSFAFNAGRNTSVVLTISKWTRSI